MDDTSQPSYYSLSDSKVLEGDVAEVNIFRSGDLSSPQTLRLQSFGGTARLGVDYDKVDEVIEFSANQDTYTSLIPTKSDSRFEPSEFVSLRLSPFGSSSNLIIHQTLLVPSVISPFLMQTTMAQVLVLLVMTILQLLFLADFRISSSSLALGIPSFASAPVALSAPIVA